MRKSEHPGFVFEGELTKEQLAFFDKNGFIKFRGFLSQDTVNLFIEEIKRIEKQLLSEGVEYVNGIPLKFGIDTNGKIMIQRMAFLNQFSKPMSDFLKEPRLQEFLKFLGPYDGRIGENEKDGLILNHYINTDNSNFSQLGWHTDSPRDLFLGLRRIMPMLNVGIHLDDCPFENGGLRVIPGTHKQNIFRMLFRKKYFIDHKTDKDEVGMDVKAGDLTVHDGRLWHRGAQSPLTGEASRRRVMYVPVVTGEYRPKHKDSPVPFYHKLGAIILINKKVKLDPETYKKEALKTEKVEA
jgi:hypothetical protein